MSASWSTMSTKQNLPTNPSWSTAISNQSSRCFFLYLSTETPATHCKSKQPSGEVMNRYLAVGMVHCCEQGRDLAVQFHPHIAGSGAEKSCLTLRDKTVYPRINKLHCFGHENERSMMIMEFLSSKQMCNSLLPGNTGKHQVPTYTILLTTSDHK